jgi:tyrosyl-tRNA synthetase
MLSRESVKTRMEGGAEEEGMSFTEFSYQLFQGYDFYKLRKDYVNYSLIFIVGPCRIVNYKLGAVTNGVT